MNPQPFFYRRPGGNGNPLARGLGFCAISQGKSCRDVVCGYQATFTGTALTYIPQVGSAISFANSAGGSGNRLAWPAVSAGAWLNGTDWTVSVLGLITGSDHNNSGDDFPALLKWGDSSNHVVVGFSQTAGGVVFYSTLDGTRVAGTVSLGAGATAISLGFPTGIGTALYTWRLTGTTLECFVNGTLRDTLAMGVHGAYTDAAIQNAETGGIIATSGKIKAYYVHNRALSNAEINMLALNPWDVFDQQPPLKRRINTVGGGAATTMGMPFGNRGTAFNGGRTFHGIIH